MTRVGVIVLAAGRSTRYSGGGHKLLAPVAGASVVVHAVRAAVESDVGDVVVVTGAEHEAVAAAVSQQPVRVLHEPHFVDGMSESLKCGVSALHTSADAVLISLGDQPTVRPGAYRGVVARWQETGAAIVVPRYAGDSSPSHPTLFAATVYDELLALRGDVGARAVVVKDASRVDYAALDWPAPRDVDTRDDLDVIARELELQPNAQRSE